MCNNEYLEQMALKYPELRRELEAGVLPEEVMDSEMKSTTKKLEGEENYDGIF